MKTAPPQPLQERSRRTADALLAACLRVLEREGFAACTVPRVAEAAKLAPATIYRRFADKDALLRAAFLQVLRERTLGGREAAEKALLRPTLGETVERLVASLLQQYRAHPRLMRALAQYIGAQPKGDFAAEAHKLITTNYRLTAGVLLRHRDRIRHEDPERAALFSVLTVSAAVEAAMLEQPSAWSVALPLGDKALVAEHTRAVVAYLRRKA